MLLTAVRYIVAFAMVFALSGVLGVGAGFLFQGIDSSQRILAVVLLVMFALYGAGVAAIVGAVTGLIYALLPARVRDQWVASALGAGVVACGAIFIRTFFYQPISTPWFVTLLLMGAAASAVSAWCVRARRTS